ncbi:MAG: ribose 5-phosphate isomerase B [Planctomycetota bacterium]|nr:ribose 5-phosphate isomerase B [Planctomycetota bacterium]
MKLAIGADHRGSEAAVRLADRLRAEGFQVALELPAAGQSCDYPDAAFTVGTAVAQGQADLGVLICGTGVGMSMAANKIHGVRAALVHDEITAEISRSHTNANVICLSADLLGLRLIEKIIELWLKTPFEGGRHAKRLAKIEAIERGRDPRTLNNQ